MKIYLVRHAQSNSNIDARILQNQTNMSVELSDIGIKQATETGAYLAEHLSLSEDNIKVWNSPYTRTRQTAGILKSQFDLVGLKYSSAESIYLTERQFGLVDDVANYWQIYKHETNHYELHKENNHDFFARPPLGESPFDTCIRLDAFLRTVLAVDTSHNTHIIVGHGAAIRGLILMDQELPFEEYAPPNPYNASVRLIDQGKYVGDIFVPSIRTS